MGILCASQEQGQGLPLSESTLKAQIFPLNVAMVDKRLNSAILELLMGGGNAKDDVEYLMDRFNHSSFA